MSYPATSTGQIREAAAQAQPTSLVIHELAYDGRPLCNIDDGAGWRRYNGHEMTMVSLGAGQVTCGSCARVGGQPMGDLHWLPSVQTVSTCPRCHLTTCDCEA